MKKPIILTWWPIIFVFVTVIGTSSVNAYRLSGVEKNAEKRVLKETYSLQLAGIAEKQEKNSRDIEQIKEIQKKDLKYKFQQEVIRQQINETKERVKALDEKMDTKFDDLKDFIRENIK